MTRYEAITNVTTVVDKEMTTLRFAYDLPLIGGQKMSISNEVFAIFLLFFLFTYITCGRLHYDRMVAHDRAYDLAMGTDDSFVCPQVNQRGWRTRVTRWSFIALWPAWLALGWLLAAVDLTTGFLFRRKAA